MITIWLKNVGVLFFFPQPVLRFNDVGCEERGENIFEVKTNKKVEFYHNQNLNVEGEPKYVKHKIKFFVDKPKDEKLCRNAQNRAGAGFTFPCHNGTCPL